MYEKFFKRLLDILISILILPFCFLIFVIIAPLIIITDGFPVFYNAERIGKNGKFFKMYKFRSMYNDSPDIRLQDGSTYNNENDPRVTKIGKILRKTSIDEIPQIINVVKGDMSFIGPRPDPIDWIDKYPDDIKIFLNVKPGITGYSQAYFRNSIDGYEKMKNDAFYAKNCNFIMDLKIFFQTIKMVIMHKDIYINEDNQKNMNIENLKLLEQLKKEKVER